MNLRERPYQSKAYSIKPSSGGFLLITRLKYPHIEVLYDTVNGNYFLYKTAEGVDEKIIDNAVKKAVQYVRHNLV